MGFFGGGLKRDRIDPVELASQIGGTLNSWFDASNTSKITTNQFRDTRDVDFPSLVQYSWLAPFNQGSGGSFTTTINNGKNYLTLSGVNNSVPSLANTNGVWASLPFTSQSSVGSSILIFAVMFTSNTGAAGAAGPTFFAQNNTDALTGRFFQVFRYYPDTAGQLTTSFLSRGTQSIANNDSAILEEQPFLISFYQTVSSTASKTVVSSCNRYANFNVSANAGYNAINENNARFVVGARFTTGGNLAPASLLTGGIGELVVISKATEMTEFSNPSSSVLSRNIKNYFIAKWGLQEASYIST